MRYANLAGRLVLISLEGLAIDVERASNSKFSSNPQSIYRRWSEFREWASELDELDGVDPALRDLEAPVPAPAQVFAIGQNYASHAAEVSLSSDGLSVFTKFPTSLTGPHAEVSLPAGRVDWEAELVVVIGTGGFRIDAEEAWSAVAGLTVGQDISERQIQLAGDLPQFSLGKSFPGFAPTGPWVVTPDEFEDPDDVFLSCSLNGETVQEARTSDMVYSVPVLIERISEVVRLLPGDLIFTGTPSGIGLAQTPPRYLAAGDKLSTSIGGIGEMVTTFVGESI